MSISVNSFVSQNMTVDGMYRVDPSFLAGSSTTVAVEIVDVIVDDTMVYLVEVVSG